MKAKEVARIILRSSLGTGHPVGGGAFTKVEHTGRKKD